MRILVSGATGFIGTPLVSHLRSQDFHVAILSRYPVESNSIVWSPENQMAPQEAFEGFDVVIHLAGEPLSLGRWGKKKRKNILESRMMGTSFLSHLLASLQNPPKRFISASAVGFYGDRGEEELVEVSPSGSGFLSRVCTSWEEASRPLKKRGVRTAYTRFGMVIGPKGGALAKMLPLYQLGLGARLGSGKQWISWIDREDLVRVFSHILQNESLEGPINVVSPNPIRQIDFSRKLADLLHKPHFLKLPAWALRLIFGSVADELLLASEKVIPTKLLATNFQFQYADLLSSLKRAL